MYFNFHLTKETVNSFEIMLPTVTLLIVIDQISIQVCKKLVTLLERCGDTQESPQRTSRCAVEYLKHPMS
jgi:hypothetical protein